MVDLVTGDTGSTLRITCYSKDTGQVLSLVGATVSLHWKVKGSLIVTSKTMTIDDAVNGIVSYKFLAAEIVAPWMYFEVQITDSSGFILSSLKKLDVRVRAEFA